MPCGLPPALAAAAMEAQQVPHPAEKLVQIERLGHVLVGAQVEAAGAVLGQGAGTEDQHGDVPVGLADRLADRIAAHPRQHEVEHDQVDAAGRLLEDFQGRGAVAHDRHAVALGDEVVLDAGGEVCFVFDDQDVFGGWPYVIPRPGVVFRGLPFA